MTATPKRMQSMPRGVILATGGAGDRRHHQSGRGHRRDGLAAAVLRAGAQVADFGVLSVPPHRHGHRRTLPRVSEAVRGAESAIVLDEHGHRFMTDIDPKAELAPRDVVARANFRIARRRRAAGRSCSTKSPMAKESPGSGGIPTPPLPDHRRLQRSLGFDWSKSRS